MSARERSEAGWNKGSGQIRTDSLDVGPLPPGRARAAAEVEPPRKAGHHGRRATAEGEPPRIACPPPSNPSSFRSPLFFPLVRSYNEGEDITKNWGEGFRTGDAVDTEVYTDQAL